MALRNVDVRKDYQCLDEWTQAEAGAFADGRTADTIRRWVKFPLERTVQGHVVRQYRFRMTRRVGAGRIDAASFREYLRTGQPQGEKA